MGLLKFIYSHYYIGLNFYDFTKLIKKFKKYSVTQNY